VNPCFRRGFSFIGVAVADTIRRMPPKPRQSDSDCGRCGGRGTVTWGYTERRCRNCGDTYRVNHRPPPWKRVILATATLVALFVWGMYEAHRRGWLKPFMETTTQPDQRRPAPTRPAEPDVPAVER
jgi:hypothetical protein